MSRKNKTLRAFLHQTQSPTIEQAWDTAWEHAQKAFHARSMQDMEERLDAAQAECERLVGTLEKVAFANEFVFLPDDVQDAVVAALAAYHKQGDRK